MYGLDPKEFDKLLNDNVTKNYKKWNIKTVNEINKEVNLLTEKFKINDRVQCIAQNKAFITIRFLIHIIKDQEPNFPNKVTWKLLNLCN